MNISRPAIKHLLRFVIYLFMVLLACVFFIVGPANTEELSGGESSTLRFYSHERKVAVLSLNEIQENFEVADMEVYDPFYQEVRCYSVVALKEIVNHVYPKEFPSDQSMALKFEAFDGYQVQVSREKINSGGASLAVGVCGEFSDWQPLPGHFGATPGPFYLVWSGSNQVAENGFFWPWQISHIGIIKEQESLGALRPRIEAGASKGSVLGHELFQRRCGGCHALDGRGGKVGPDLQSPQNILAYRPEEQVRAFIKSPSKFRHSPMPDFPDLSNSQLDSLIEYFRYLHYRKSVSP